MIPRMRRIVPDGPVRPPGLVASLGPRSFRRVREMKLGDVANAEAMKYGKPLDGVRILAVEQMQALPYGTQLLARLGADVVKVEAPGAGESGRGSLPAMIDPNGQRAGATFLRNNLDKRSITVDLKHPRAVSSSSPSLRTTTSSPRTSRAAP